MPDNKKASAKKNTTGNKKAVVSKKVEVKKTSSSKKQPVVSKSNNIKSINTSKIKTTNINKKSTSKKINIKSTGRKVSNSTKNKNIKDKSIEKILVSEEDKNKKDIDNKKVDAKKALRDEKQSINNKLDDKKEIVKSKFFPSLKLKFNLKDCLKLSKKVKFKELDDKELAKGKSTKKEKTSIKSPILTDKTKKWLIIIALICVIVIIAEVGYLVYYHINMNRNVIYYDSLNSVAVDDTDIIGVGSSNFKYSKYNDYTNGLEKAKIIKYDKNGKIIFEKMYDKGINTTFSSVVSVNDGYIVVGSGVFSEEEQNNEGREAVIIKYDKDGNIVWEKFYQVITNTRFNKVIATIDGYIVVGQSIYANMEMGNHTTGGGIIVKYDFDGNEVWHNNHGGMKSGNFNDVIEVNGDFYVVGKDATDYANIIKYSKNGKYQWHKNYGYTDGIGFTGIAYLDNSLFVVGSKKVLPEGTTDDDNRDTTNTDALLVKYDLDGKVLFEKNFGGSNYERYNSIITHFNNLYIVGHTTSSDAGLKVTTDGELMTGMLVRYDKNGNILKKESFGGSNDDNLTSIITDGVSLYISAYSNSGDGNITTSKNNGKDYFGKVIKLDFKFRTLMVK